MKTILILMIFFFIITQPVFGELDDTDLDKIRLIVKEEIDTKIKASETRMKEHINTQIESVDKRLSLVTTLIVGLIALIVLAVGIPQILMALHSRKDDTLQKQIETLTEKMETLTQEIETLKQQRIHP